MSYLTCPRCRLTIRIRAPYLAMRNCPRCLGRAGLPTPMYASQVRGMAPSALEQSASAPAIVAKLAAADGSAPSTLPG